MKNTINKILITILIFSSAYVGGLSWQYFNNTAIADNLSLDEQEATIRAIKKVSPAVVSIIVDEEKDVINLTTGVVTKVKDRVANGTGFLISADGYILTNRHIIDSGTNRDNAQYQILMSNGKKYYAQFIGNDPAKDLGVLKIFDKDLPYIEMGDSNDLAQGTTVMTIGNALGKYQNSVTKGIISALGRDIEASDNHGNMESLANVIQTDADINPGNSGGPLVNLAGKVVGINVALDRGGQSIGFAIPINDAKVIVNSIRTEDRVVRPSLGVRYAMLTPELAAKNNLSRNNGAWIARDSKGNPGVLLDSPAEKGGIWENDIIFEINAIHINDSNTLFDVIQKFKPGARIGLKIQRGNKVIIRIVTLGEFK
ncbi:MAG: trypsin-like peptidase domain-containing protein [Patescibacteria group bacterium]